MSKLIQRQYKEIMRKPKDDGKLVFMDQVEVAARLEKDLGFLVKDGLYFDSVDLVDGKSSETMVDEALTGKYTYAQLLKRAQKYYEDKRKSMNIH